MWQFAQARAGRGILVFDDGWHRFSVALWLFGSVREVMAWIGRDEVVEDLDDWGASFETEPRVLPPDRGR